MHINDRVPINGSFDGVTGHVIQTDFYLEYGRDPPHVDDVGAEVLADAAVEANQRHTEYKRQQHELNNEST